MKQLPLLYICLLLLSPCVRAEADSSPKLKEGTASETSPERPADIRGFLWKPVSESTGTLVILTPHDATFGKTLGHAILTGTFGSETAPLRHEHHNGKRPHFYFAQPGPAYGRNIKVEVPLRDGSVFTLMVPNGATRFEP